MPSISVCIPCYNRPEFLEYLLQSIVCQEFEDYEILVADDNSPRQSEIISVVNKIKNLFPMRQIHLFLNPFTYGYDRNFRELINRAHGEYCLFMGDDDYMLPGALRAVYNATKIPEQPSVILRSWHKVDRETCQHLETFRYFSSDLKFKGSVETAALFFRRSVAIAGFTVKTRDARAVASSEYDGTLLYQVYLATILTFRGSGYYIANPYFAMRKDRYHRPTHFFGTAASEQKRFSPGKLTYQQSLDFIDGMLDVCTSVSEKLDSIQLKNLILNDMRVYSFPLLSVQRRNGILNFLSYSRHLVSRGLGGNFFFYMYFISLLFLGVRFSELIIKLIKKVVGRTPHLSMITRSRESHEP